MAETNSDPPSNNPSPDLRTTEGKQPDVPKEMIHHYTTQDEQNRLHADFLGTVERECTMRFLHRYLPPPPAKIADIGGAAGVYSFALAKLGYEVSLVDPVPLHIEQAKKTNDETSGEAKLVSIALGDGRDLGCFSNETFHAVLMMGPLYHLQERHDRIKALTEAYRITKVGGVLLCAAISKFSSFIDGLDRDFLLDDAFCEIVKEDLLTGKHNNPTDNANYFTTVFMHSPEELASEVKESGFRDVEVLAVEGPLWAIKEESKLREEEQLQKVFEILETIEKEPAIVGTSPHMIAVGKKL